MKKQILSFILPTLLSPLSFANADLILMNADVIPMTEENARSQAIAIKNGVISRVGTNEEVLKEKSANTLIRDLAGKTVTPGFIDAHGHFANFIPLVDSLFLYPSPLGTTDDIATLQSQIQTHLHNEQPNRNELQLAFGYDDSVLKEKRHPTKHELDAVSQGYKLCVLHISGHLATCNSAGLAALGYSNETPNPKGGVIHKDKNGELTGLFEEAAVYALLPYLAVSNKDEAIVKAKKTQALFHSYGITTAQEGLAAKGTLDLMQQLADEDALTLDLLAYVKWSIFEDVVRTQKLGTYQNGFKIAGMKITADGSPQGKTAYLSTPYVKPPENQTFDYHGYPVLTQSEMDRFVDLAFKHRAPLIAHTNGDAASDLLLNAIEKANQTYGKRDHRTTMVHAQTVRLDQIKRMKAAGMMASFFPAHTYFWGDFHQSSVLGEWRASNISPTGWSKIVDLPFTIHMDTPVAYPDQLLNMWTAVNRITRSGKTLGENHKITPYQALEAITKTAAFQNFEEAHKGTIETGKLADLVILDQNPLKIDPMKISQIQVLETIKAGETVFNKAG